MVDDAEFESAKEALAEAEAAEIEQAQGEGEDPDIESPSDGGNTGEFGGNNIRTSITGRIPWQAKVLCGVIAVLTCIAMVVIVVQILKKNKTDK